MAAVVYFVLIPMTYACTAIFIFSLSWHIVRVVSGLRISLAGSVGPEKRPKFWGSLVESLLFLKIIKTHPVQWFLLILFHITFLFLIAGHIELIGHSECLQIVPHEIFLGAGFIGLVLLVNLSFFLFRRFHSPIREMSEPSDYYILILLILTVLSGSQMNLARSLYGYSTMSVADYRIFLSGLTTFHPVVPDVIQSGDAGHSILLIIHVLCANLVFALFPSSNLVHTILTVPLSRLQRH
ncbi:respiratory nitrate reductase subunit gamma [bacterium]|nr:respiratory nitrate reductase subunit gamma [candidate division CSSED10-310 bacterium]